MNDERSILTIDGVTARENRLVNHFFHDFKGELSTVIMCLQALRDGLMGTPPDAVQARWLTRAVGNAQHMVQLINDFRDLTQMEEDAFPLVPEQVDLAAHLQALVAEMSELFCERAQHLALSLPPLPVVTFRATLFDRLVRDVLQVATYNARHGSPLHLSVQVASTDAGPELTLSLRFEGVTFPPERLATVFDKMGQASVGLQLGRGYTLLFCREAARTLGGEIGLRPWEAKGNEVEIRLPIQPVA